MATSVSDIIDISQSSCVICHCEVCTPDDMLSISTDKGTSSLLQYSIARGDRQLTEYLGTNPAVVKYHRKCRNDYAHVDRYLHQMKRKASTNDTLESKSKTLRSSTISFEWRSNCFFCGLPVVLSPFDKGHVREVLTMDIDVTINEKCAERGPEDPWAVEVKGRLALVSDLRAADAKYHVNCHTCFYNFRSKPTLESKRRGRPTNGYILEIFNDACQWMETHCELITVLELRDEMRRMADDPDSVWSVPYLKMQLQERYGDDIWFASVTGHKDVVCFRRVAARIVNKKWYDERDSDPDKESDRIVIAAAQLIKASIRDTTYDTEQYPLNSAIKDRKCAKQWVPRLLQMFLSVLITDEVKQIALGHSIVQATRPRSVISPVLFGVGVSLDHVLASEWLVTTLSRLGYSVSSDEVNRYKQSVVQTDGNDLPPCDPHAFTQWAADNVDHNVSTLDGSGTFHGMGMMSMSVYTNANFSLPPGFFDEVPIKRMQRVKFVKLNAESSVPILAYTSPVPSPLSVIQYQPWSSIISSLPTAFISSNLDLMWHASWFFCHDENPRPSWGGFMQITTVGKHPPPTEFRMMPIIDMNPGDRSCILSTLSFILNQAFKIGIMTPCVTFDQPLWLKAVEIIQAESLNMVCRLGGFHTIMSYLGSLGHIMSGSGLVDALECCYGPNAVTSMVTGKAVTRAIRGHFMVQSALCIKLMQSIMKSSPDDEGGESDTNDGSVHDKERISEADIVALKALYNNVIDRKS